MARIRTIKPEFFLHEDLADLSPLHRLLFIGLWTQADREGRLKDKPRRIKAAVLPYDDCDINEMLEDLAREGFIHRYIVDGDAFIEIPSFNQHQNPHIKEAASLLPPPGGLLPASLPDASRSLREFPVPAPGEHGASTMLAPYEPGGSGKGREGKGKEGNGSGKRSRRELTQEATVIRNEIALLARTEYPPASFDALETRLRDRDMTGEEALALVRWAASDPFWGEQVRLDPSILFRPKHWAGLLAKSKAAPLPQRQPTRRPVSALPPDSAWHQPRGGEVQQRRCIECAEYVPHRHEAGDWIAEPHACGTANDGAAAAARRDA